MDFEFRQSMMAKRDKVEDLFDYEGCKIGCGSYGHVYKATPKDKSDKSVYALKLITRAGLSISSCREIGLLRELKHPNVLNLRRVFLSHADARVWLLFDYAEYDLLGIIKHDRRERQAGIISIKPQGMVKSIMFQVLSGIHYLHNNWVLHRDIKPANILVMGDGVERGRVKIGDFGFCRLFNDPLRPLPQLDPVVVTSWYRPPELLLNAQHYNAAVDIWSIGCLFAELLTLTPLFYSPEWDASAFSPYNKPQLDRVFQILGFPSRTDLRMMKNLPEFYQLKKSFKKTDYYGSNIENYLRIKNFTIEAKALALLKRLLLMNPTRRITAEDAMKDRYFGEMPLPQNDVFAGMPIPYPKREFLK